MTPDQADNLLELLAAANVLGRLDDNAPDVWAAALNDLDYRDCMTAAAHLIRTERWVKIADIRDTVHRIRAERIAAANPIYDGRPDESGAESAAGIRRLIDHAAAGRLPAQPVRAALESGAGYSHDGKTRAVLAIVGSTLPGPTTALGRVLAVECPHCHAQPKQRCTGGARRREPNRNPHASRYEAAGVPTQLTAGAHSPEAS